jgi:hypothetical protein
MANMGKLYKQSFRAKRKAFYLRAIYTREIFLAYLCIFLIESACLFPAVWVR